MKYTIISAALLFSIASFAENPAHSVVGNENLTPPTVEENSSNMRQEENKDPENNNLDEQQVIGNNQDSEQNNTPVQQEEDSYAEYEEQLEGGNQTIQDLESEIANVNNNLAMYRATVIKYASDLLNIPYDEYTVTEIAIPILKNAIKAGPKDATASARLLLLENYATNILQLKTLLNNYVTAIKSAKTPEEFMEWADVTNAKFKYEDVVKTYTKAYPNKIDLKKTYLGSIISTIETQLANRGKTGAKDAMIKSFDGLKSLLK